jgi:glycosyltransferase involved in cell wall biosynthesis
MSTSVLDPDAPLKIAYLTYRGKPHVGGQGVYTRHLTKALVDLGHSVEVFGGQPYPVLDERVTLTQLPSLDTFNDYFPGRFPGFWELKSREDLLEMAVFMTGVFPEPLAFSARAARELLPRAGEFDLVHDNQCLGYGISKIEKRIPTIVTLHHPITKDRELEMSHAKTLPRRLSVGRWYSFVKMQGKVASKMPRIVVVSQNSIDDIHTDMGVDIDRMRLVPVGVDPDLFKPLPHVERRPGRLITTASADVALKGLSYLLEAMAKLRTERDITLTIIGKPRPGHSMDLIDSYGLAPPHRVRVGRERRAHRRAVRRSRDGRRPEPLRGLQPAGDRGDVYRNPARRDRRRRAARGHRRRRRDRPRLPGRRRELADRRHRPGARQPGTARQGRRGRPPSCPRALDVEEVRRADRRAVPRGAGDAPERREAPRQRTALTC